MGISSKEVAGIRAILEVLADQDDGINALEVLADATTNFLVIQSKPDFLNEALGEYCKQLKRRIEVAKKVGLKECADEIREQIQELEDEIKEVEEKRRTDISNN